MPAVSAEGGVDFMLPPQSDHQSKGLLYSLFLGCVSRGFLGFSHEDIIDFDIGAHGPHSVCRVYRCMILYTSGPRRHPEVPVAHALPSRSDGRLKMDSFRHFSFAGPRHSARVRPSRFSKPHP